MKFSFYQCPDCFSPMDRPILNCDYWRCAFCGMDMDGWEPVDGAIRITIEDDAIPIGNDTIFFYSGFHLHIDADHKMFVESLKPMYRKHAFREVHHFDTMAVREAFTGEGIWDKLKRWFLRF